MRTLTLTIIILIMSYAAGYAHHYTMSEPVRTAKAILEHEAEKSRQMYTRYAHIVRDAKDTINFRVESQSRDRVAEILETENAEACREFRTANPNKKKTMEVVK